MLGGLYLSHNLTSEFVGVSNASPTLVGPCSWALDPALLPNSGNCLFRFGGTLTGSATVTLHARLGGGRYRPGITGSVDGTIIYTTPATTGPLTPVIFEAGPVSIGPGLTRLKFSYTASGNWTLDNWFLEFYSLAPIPPTGATSPDPTVRERGDDLDVRTDVSRASFSLAAGVRNIGNALARRLITPRGGLLYDPSYGTDIRAYLNAGFTPGQIAKLGSEIEAEVLKDPRVEAAAVAVQIAGSSTTITVTVELAQGPFELVFRSDGLTVELITVAALGGGA